MRLGAAPRQRRRPAAASVLISPVQSSVSKARWWTPGLAPVEEALIGESSPVGSSSSTRWSLGGEHGDADALARDLSIEVEAQLEAAAPEAHGLVEVLDRHADVMQTDHPCPPSRAGQYAAAGPRDDGPSLSCGSP
ncbi:MAG: hypothetical protein R3F30_11420 [Planctomycetota bacterium]